MRDFSKILINTKPRGIWSRTIIDIIIQKDLDRLETEYLYSKKYLYIREYRKRSIDMFCQLLYYYILIKKLVTIVQKNNPEIV